MMSRHFALNSELTGAIAKRLPHAKNQPYAPGSFFNQFVTDIYIYIHIYIYNHRVLIVRINIYTLIEFKYVVRIYLYIYTSALRACLRCAAGGHLVSAGGSLRSPGGDIG